MRQLRHAAIGLASAFALVLAAPAAEALPVGYDLQITVDDASGGGNIGSMNLQGLQTMGLVSETTNPGAGTTTAALTGPMMGSGGLWTLDSWDSTLKEDPWITNNFVVTNNTGGVATFTITVSSPIPAFNANQIVQSTIQLSILDDDNAGGASASSVAGIDVYQGKVNGTTALSLLDDPFAISCTSPVDCVINGNTADGVASQPFGPAVATNIGITVTFQLSNGDSASVLSRFEIVPEPGTGLLMTAGLLALAGLHRRR
ncbi:MAG: PEP-CTERM sorting domain-containing protein [Myxococcota bacterium]